MSYGMGFYTGLRALRTSQLAIQTIGQNVANVNTQGYSRQEAILAASLPVTVQRGFQVGTGVQVNTIRRITDDSLLARIRTQEGFFGKAGVLNTRLKEMEGVFGEPGEAGISNLLTGLFSSLSGLRADPSDRALRGGAIQAGQNLAEGFNLLASRLGELSQGALRDVQARLKEVNSHAAAIADLNVKIGEIEASTVRANDLRDARDQHIQAISRLLDATAVERANGQLDLMAGGYVLVAGSRSVPLEAARGGDGMTTVQVADTDTALQIRGGEISALLEVERTQEPRLVGAADELARNLILEVNRIHSTGIPGSGPFSRLRAENAVRDGDDDGSYDDELLGSAGLPFAMAAGDLFVSVSDEATGRITRTRLAIDPTSMTVGDLVTALNGVANLSASLDPSGRLLVAATPGHRFDFATRLDSTPDKTGTFGARAATVTGTKAGPFAFTALPAGVTVAVDGGPPAVLTLTAADFRNPQVATAEEVAAALNDRLATAGLNAAAVVVAGRIALRSGTEGGGSSLQVSDVPAHGVPGLLGLSTALDQGSDLGVAVTVSGSYTGSSNRQLRFEAAGDGQIGVTAGLQVKVLDDQGTLLATLDVGQGYSPGDTLEVADGIRVSFGPGTVSAAGGDLFALDALADSDTTDLLVAFGLNSFFKGTGAADIGVVKGLLDNPDALCAGLSEAPGDGDNLRRLLALREEKLDSLGTATFEGFYADILGHLGFEANRAETLAESEADLLGYLEDRRQEVSGVSLDEEMLDLVRFQQSFQAASRFINTVAELTQVLIDLGS